ncbi:MAG: hypothetical protein F7B17_04790 [Desulfurococcales archaeon]|nr:hypothetical protein [Desulfurococcales archaeon]
MHASAAVRLAVLLGLVSLLADTVYEGGRSVQGPLLEVLEAPALAAGAIAVGEALAYASRPLGALLARSLGVWPSIALGYALSLTSIPLLAFASTWEWVVALYLAERLGKGLRAPGRDAVLAGYGRAVGATGRLFALHEVLDQVGALAGPLAVAALIAGYGWRTSLAALSIPAAASLALLAYAAHSYPQTPGPTREEKGGFGGLGVYSLLHPIAAPQWSVVSLALAYSMGAEAVALVYAAAMGLDALIAWVTGVMIDKGRGLHALLIVPLGGLMATAGAALSLSGAPWHLAAVLAGLGVGAAYGALESAGRAWVALAWGGGVGGYAVYGALRGVAFAVNGAILAGALSLGASALIAGGLALSLASTIAVVATVGRQRPY